MRSSALLARLTLALPAMVPGVVAAQSVTRADLAGTWSATSSDGAEHVRTVLKNGLWTGVISSNGAVVGWSCGTSEDSVTTAMPHFNVVVVGSVSGKAAPSRAFPGPADTLFKRVAVPVATAPTDLAGAWLEAKARESKSGKLQYTRMLLPNNMYLSMYSKDGQGAYFGACGQWRAAGDMITFTGNLKERLKVVGEGEQRALVRPAANAKPEAMYVYKGAMP